MNGLQDHRVQSLKITFFFLHYIFQTPKYNRSGCSAPKILIYPLRLLFITPTVVSYNKTIFSLFYIHSHCEKHKAQ